MADDRTPNLECRMYEQKFPEVDDLVVVNVRSIAEMGAYVSLLEYNNIEGMILLSELSRRRIRSINKLIRVGRNEITTVLRVDEEKGYIDLSKRRVAPEDMVMCEERYNKSKAVHSILRHLATITRVDVQELYELIGWPLAKKFGHCYDAFKQAVLDTSVLDEIEFPTTEMKETLLVNIKRRLTPQALRIRADLEVTCFKKAGIEAVKEALHAGTSLSTEDQEIKIRLDATPVYVLTTTALEKQAGIDLANSAIEKIKEVIATHGGTCTVKEEPSVVNAHDEFRGINDDDGKDGDD